MPGRPGKSSAKPIGSERCPNFGMHVPMEVRDALNALCAEDRRALGQMVAWLIEQEVARRAVAKGGAS